VSGPLRIALLGTGQVGRAFIELLETRADPDLVLVHVANSRAEWRDLEAAPAQLVIDATASDGVADRHAAWLARGVHVVTANKLGQGASLARWQAIDTARTTSGAHYGDSATVGAGLPLLRSLRALRRGGDAIDSIAGVLSGSMAWLLSRHDGAQPFSHLVREARAAGYTEPDPRIDLRGEDVRRKLLILARAAGIPLDADDVRMEAVSTAALDAATPALLDAALESLDAPMAARLAERPAGERLHLVARWSRTGGASVALECLPSADPLGAGAGTDNRVAIRCARYAAQPLVIQGPGAGAGITAAALLDDVLAIRDASREVTRAVQPAAISARTVVSAKNESIAWGRLIA
jgi:homoserine dehydrogenase